MRTELIKIVNGVIDKIEMKVVNARDLHCFLESKQDFSTWIKKRIFDYGFVENTDFIRFHKKMEANNATIIEYSLTLDMAKELAMIERTDKGRQARKYFIECEKQLMQILLPNTITHQQEQALIREINVCVERLKEHCNDISNCLCKHFKINNRSELPLSKLDDAFSFLRSITKKDVVGRRYFVEVKITDHMFHGEKTIFGKCNDFNALLTHLALELGYKIDRLSSSPQTLSF